MKAQYTIPRRHASQNCATHPESPAWESYRDLSFVNQSAGAGEGLPAEKRDRRERTGGSEEGEQNAGK